MSAGLKMFIYCDNHNTRVPVADFGGGPGRWAPYGRRLPGLFVAIGGQSRSRRYDLRCRKCRRCKVADETKLAAYLDGVAARGESCVSLTELEANI